MNHIDGYFAKFKSAFANAANKKEIIAAACLEKAGVTVSPTHIEIQNQVLRLNINSSAKSVIFMNKKAVLESINLKIKPPIVDIR